MKIQQVKGTRDFYPQQMAVRNFIIDGWKAASVRNGFVEYDSPIFEYLKMYQVKSGDEIVEQLFNLTDRGGRELAIRPEMTPSLARMVNQKINSLPRPIKWFSVPRLCRAERPQKGRLREFFQWNIDIIGVDDVLADAEIIFCSLDYLRQVGLTSKDAVARISSRKMLAAVLKSVGIAESELDGVYAVLDKRSKVDTDVFEKMLAEKIADKQKCSKVIELMSVEDIDTISKVVELSDEAKAAVEELKTLFELLESMGVSQWCLFDIGIVRGLAYYTGAVYEIYDRASKLRAIGGGGRYDNLLSDLGGPDVPATGFAMGDCVLEILLREKGLLDEEIAEKKLGSVDYYVVYTDANLQQKAVELTAKLRANGCSSVFSYKGGNLGKQLKQASAAGAKKCVIVGDEIAKDQIAVKDMSTGDQKVIRLEEFLSGL
jgi:histidyl-tRNA synthetase